MVAEAATLLADRADASALARVSQISIALVLEMTMSPLAAAEGITGPKATAASWRTRAEALMAADLILKKKKKLDNADRRLDEYFVKRVDFK